MANMKMEVIFTLVNEGFSEIVMNAARNEGAHGGTIIRARGSASKVMEDKYGIVITPEKELLIILVNAKNRDTIMTAINKAAGIETKARGIIFSLPVSNVVGLKFE